MTSTLVGHITRRVRGAVHTSADSGYAPEIAGFNTAIVHSPDLVVAAEDAADVAEAVRFAREHGLRVTVQSTGHGAYKPHTSGMLISTRRLTDVHVDPATRIVTAGAGVRWASVIAAAAEHGLAPICGSSTTVGVMGYTLGGGLGPLARSHGFSSDYIEGATVVTGTGEIIEVSATEHPDLLWALRGGKSGLGIVTALRIRLVPLTTLYGGALLFDEPHIEAALRTWLDWTKTADAHVTTSIIIARFPDLEVIPPPLRARRVLALRFAFPGATDEGAHLAAPLRACAPVYIDALGELPAAEIARVHNDPTEPGPFWVTSTMLADADQNVASALLRHVGPGTDSPLMGTEVRHLGAATARDIDGGSAVGGRSARYTLGIIGVQNPAWFAEVIPAAADRLLADVAAWLAPEVNINFLSVPKSPEHFASAWPPETHAKLERVRRQYDPDRVFAYGYTASK